ncbi:hypothetical protein UA08_00180 [Talaromyces atroroseus]|uniref:Uncharacterized protein n=1 Tax=Talaromyces atroroseus TaxID=1441469 RepID=A0A225AZJ5_TALAT|nr:hypothetical protein UA08_00180 [Talaromyces atroroseus]OKL63874.1 hypothetical protein UA08_00180 [Talaromyces atroroseus]
MSHSGPNPLPPTQILTSRSTSQSAALDFLKAYLVRAVNDPSLQPSAMITEHGPISRTTAAAPNLTLHNLKRVQAGLAGEILGRDLTLNTTSSSAAQSRGTKTANGETNAADGNNNNKDEQWEDREKWELEQAGTVTGGDGTEELLNNAAGEEIEVDENGMPISGVIDKEERKRRKKERRQAERKARKEQAKEAGEEEMEMSE